jgi:hypothetical protein
MREETCPGGLFKPWSGLNIWTTAEILILMHAQRRSEQTTRASPRHLLRNSLAIALTTAAITFSPLRGNAETLYTTPEKNVSVAQLAPDTDTMAAAGGYRKPGIYTWPDGERYYCTGRDVFLHDNYELLNRASTPPASLSQPARLQDLPRPRTEPNHGPKVLLEVQVRLPHKLKPIGLDELKAVGCFVLILSPLWGATAQGLYKNRRIVFGKKKK